MPGDLALIFGKGKPKEGVEVEPDESEDNSYDKIPADFRDHCDAAFDALKSGKSKDFCEELWLAIKAYEETPHEENETDEMGEMGEDEE